MLQPIRNWIHTLHRFTRLSLRLGTQTCAMLYAVALLCYALAPHAADYFAALHLAREAAAVAPALLAGGGAMAVIGQLVLGGREEA